MNNKIIIRQIDYIRNSIKCRKLIEFKWLNVILLIYTIYEEIDGYRLH